CARDGGSGWSPWGAFNFW
nr:immunoglobulin heavy chain junction region [Macaca mulatta]MOW32425.1 immunoglobulin heavy chain junction region [Macaca mulatta]MOW33540.1 immunoglobulin heavy chain junction region [Macaca mulatta]